MVYRRDMFGTTSKGVKVEKSPSIKVAPETADTMQMLYEGGLIANPLFFASSPLRTAGVEFLLVLEVKLYHSVSLKVLCLKVLHNM